MTLQETIAVVQAANKTFQAKVEELEAEGHKLTANEINRLQATESDWEYSE